MQTNNSVVFSIDQLEKIGSEIAEKISESKIFCLEGEMGSGKTTLAEFIVRALGSKANVQSPTFSLINQYPTQNSIIYHSDLYRIGSLEELILTGFEDHLYEKDSVHLIEWHRVAAPILPKPFHLISLTKLDENTRKLNYQWISA